MFFPKKLFTFLIIQVIYLSSFLGSGQTTSDSYEKLWNVINSEKETEQTKLNHLNVYINKARIEKNYLKEFLALEKKTFKVPHKDAIVLINKMLTIGYALNNDSLIERGISAKTSFYYANRDFKDALNYAVEAENFNLKTKDLYQLSLTRLYIGNIYYHTKYYSKALEYFNLSKKFFEVEKKEYPHAYITTLYSLSKTYWKLNEADSLLNCINKAKKIIPLLKESAQESEIAYIDYITGGYYFLEKDYDLSEKYFLQALPEITKNEDFTNQHVIYLYLGKIAWEQNQKEKAVVSFLKIDQLFKENNFLNYELRETYDYLIEYYKEKQEPRKQLEATESLIKLNSLFEKEQQYLTQTLHYELETKKLETSKIYLQKQLATNKSKNLIWFILSGVFCFGFLAYAVWQNRQKKQWRLRFDSLIQESVTVEDKKTIPSDILEIIEQHQNTEVDIELLEKLETNGNELILNELSLTEIRLLGALEKFEIEKGYLKPLKLDDFALQLNTNRNTLSKLLNTHKEGFPIYIGRLRIKQMILDLQQQPQIRKFSMQGLAETYGFSNSKTFGVQFKMVTGLTPAYFIKQLEIDDSKSTYEI